MARAFTHGFAGGGIAASSLAIRLSRAGFGPALIVDPMRPDPRTLAFWAAGPNALDPFVVHTWRTLRIVGDGQVIERALAPWRYAIFPAAALRAEAVRAVTETGGQVITGRVDRIDEGSDGAQLVAGDARFDVDWAYDSRRAADPPEMCQSFDGWWIETEDPAFDPDVVTLMDFRAPQQLGGVRFFHVMPVSTRRALVTGVNIAPEPRPVDVDAYVRGPLGIARFTITGREAGVTPASTRPARRRLGAHTLAIGVLGGRLKASTGYAVSRIQADADAIVTALARGAAPFPTRRASRRYRVLDRLLLRVIADHGPGAEAIFVALFAANPIGRVLRFLDERASVGELAALGMRLPRWAWFARAALALLAHAVARRAGRHNAAWDLAQRG